MDDNPIDVEHVNGYEIRVYPNRVSIYCEGMLLMALSRPLAQDPGFYPGCFVTYAGMHFSKNARAAIETIATTRDSQALVRFACLHGDRGGRARTRAGKWGTIVRVP